jgi:pyruvate/2-oxoglutarate dehydrogenase complex dihydrolipoamide acyltransferase (E2) component
MKLIKKIFTPQESVNDEFVTLLDVKVINGQEVQVGDVIAEFETSKAVLELIAEDAGFIKVLCKPKTDVKVGSVLFEIYDQKIEGNIVNDPMVVALNSLEKITPELTNIKFSNAAKAFLDKGGIATNDYKDLLFVTTKDLIKKENIISSMGIVEPKVVKANPILPQIEELSFEDLSSNKKREAEYLSVVNSASLVSRLSVSINVKNISEIERNQNYISTTPLPIIVFETSRLLVKYPKLNSFFQDNKLAKSSFIHIGFAIDDGIKGLKVAAIQNANNLSLLEIEDSISNLSQKYSEGKLTKDDLTKSTFTITDLFSTNVTSFHPLVNANNSCILGISSFINNQFTIDLSFDHRVTDGKEISSFLSDLKYRLESRFSEGQSKSIGIVDCIRCLRSSDDDFDGNLYFLKALNSKTDGYICYNCLTGW